MTSQSRVLLITKEDTTANSVRSVLKSNRLMSLAGVCGEVSELRSYMEDKTTGAIIVDIDSNPSRMLNELSTVVTEHPETRFIVLSSNLDQKLMLEAMQAGARHFLQKKSMTSELDQVLERLICISNVEKKKAASLNSVLSVFSASGGCGATTVAINLANELRLESAKPVLMVDLDYCYGALSNYLGVKSQYGITDVLKYKGQIDQHLIKSIASDYMDDFQILANPAGLENHQNKQLEHEKITEAIEACRDGYRYTIVDAPRLSQPVAANLAAVSKLVLIVLQPTVKDVKFAKHIVSSLIEHGTDPKKIMPLVNRFRRRGMDIRLEDCKKTLGLDSLYHVRSDWRHAMSCINRGQPLAEVAARAGLRRDFRKLATNIHKQQTNGSSKGLRQKT